MKNNKGKKVILFDLDNTLIDFAKMKRLSCEAAIDAMIDAGLKMSRKKALGKMFDLYSKHGWEHQKIFQVFLREVNGKVDYNILAPGVIAYRRIKDGLLYSYPGVSNVLKELKREGYVLAVLSDAPRIQAWLRLCSMRISDIFDAVITYDDTRKRKPNKMPFVLAMKRLGVKPEYCIMIGDSVKRDILTAKRLGMTTVLARYGHGDQRLGSYGRIRDETSRGKADYEIKDIRKLPALMRKITRVKASVS